MEWRRVIGVLLFGGSAFATGCSAVLRSSPTPVYVDLAALARQRPEWQGVTGLDRQITQLNNAYAAAEAVAASSASARVPSAIPSAPGLPMLPETASPSPGFATRSWEVTPQEQQARIERIRSDLQEAASGEEALFDINLRHRSAIDLLTALIKTDNDFASKRLAVLSQFQQERTNLQLKVDMYRSWLQEFSPAEVRTPVAQQDYNDLDARLNHATAALNAVNERLRVALAKNNADRIQREQDLHRQFAANLSEQIAAHASATAARIAQAVRSATVLESREAASRLRNYENPAFYTFQPADLPVAHTFTPTAPVPPPPPADPGLVQGPVQAQVTALENQRLTLLNYLAADTRTWAEGIAAAQNWSLQPAPHKGIPDRTARFEQWIHDHTIPIAVKGAL